MSSKLLLVVSTALWIAQTLAMFQTASSCDGEEITAIARAVKAGELSKARHLAQEALQSGCKEEDLAQLYQSHADVYLEHIPEEGEPLLHFEVGPKARLDGPGCWNFNTNEYVLEMWDQCCSQATIIDSDATDGFLLGGISGSNSDYQCLRRDDTGSVTRMCCKFAHGSSSYLRLPALKELALRLHVKLDVEFNGSNATGMFTETYDLEQDGFLRKFDPAGILWPTGYLLSLCVAAPRLCGVPEIYSAIKSTLTNTKCPIAIELGSGIGAPSVALARTLERTLSSSIGNNYIPALVLATDKALQGLALATSNSRAASAGVKTAQLDHYNLTSIQELREQQCPSGFAIVLGSSLQAMFDESTHDKDHHLWSVLDLLLDSDNPNAIALLAHTVKSLQAPRNGMFERIRAVSGNHFGMTTRYGESSDFEISIFRRRRHEDDQEL